MADSPPTPPAMTCRSLRRLLSGPIQVNTVSSEYVAANLNVVEQCARVSQWCVEEGTGVKWIEYWGVFRAGWQGSVISADTTIQWLSTWKHEKRIKNLHLDFAMIELTFAGGCFRGSTTSTYYFSVKFQSFGRERKLVDYLFADF